MPSANLRSLGMFLWRLLQGLLFYVDYVDNWGMGIDPRWACATTAPTSHHGTPLSPALLWGSFFFGFRCLWSRDAQPSRWTMAMPGNNFLGAVKMWAILMFIVVVGALIGPPLLLWWLTG